MWARIFPQVFHHHRPQASVARDLQALGLRLPLSTLARGLQRLVTLCQPIKKAIAARQALAAVAQADETSWPAQYIAGPKNAKPRPEGGGKPRHWLWMCCTADTVRLWVLLTCGLDSGRKLLDSLGLNGAVTLVCDCWSTYRAWARRCPQATLQLCWVHQRRCWVEVRTGFPELKEWAEDWLQQVSELFRLARQRRQTWQPDLPLEQQNEEFAQRHQRLAQRLKEFFEAAVKEGLRLIEEREQMDDAPPADGAAVARVDAQGKVMASLLKHERGLCVFLHDPRVPMENNLSERILRGPVISRYLSFGSGGPRGAAATGVLLSVFETVHLAGLNPYTWTQDWLQACARNQGQPPGTCVRGCRGR